MKKSCYSIIKIFLLITILLPIDVKANIMCNDGTPSPSCSDCHRGCCSHHGGCSSGYSSSSNSGGTTNNYSNNNSASRNYNYTPPEPVIQEPPKSSDTSLKEVTINYKDIEISDNMSYSTKRKNVDVNVTTNDYKAKAEYDNNVDLNIGDNFINIKVTAEDGSIKEYKLNIIRKRILSSNKI